MLKRCKEYSQGVSDVRGRLVERCVLRLSMHPVDCFGVLILRVFFLWTFDFWAFRASVGLIFFFWVLFWDIVFDEIWRHK